MVNYIIKVPKKGFVKMTEKTREVFRNNEKIEESFLDYGFTKKKENADSFVLGIAKQHLKELNKKFDLRLHISDCETIETEPVNTENPNFDETVALLKSGRLVGSKTWNDGAVVFCTVGGKRQRLDGVAEHLRMHNNAQKYLLNLQSDFVELPDLYYRMTPQGHIKLISLEDLKEIEPVII